MLGDVQFEYTIAARLWIDQELKESLRDSTSRVRA